MARRLRRAMGRHDRRDGREALVARLDHLEASLMALQDSVYRDQVRHEEELATIRKRLEPENLARELSEDARRRGL